MVRTSRDSRRDFFRSAGSSIAASLGVSHLDDALQAPPNTQHFDGYRSGANMDSPFKAGEHIPGLNVGGWFDAGDYDNIANSQYRVIQNLALAYSTFNLKWAQLSVDENARSVEMHRPDGFRTR